MAIVFCRECKKEVSDAAATCPHCGIAEPGKGAKPKPTAKDTIVGLVVVCAVVGGLVFACTDSKEEKAAAAAKVEADAAACKKDLQCIGDKASMVAARPCAAAIERLARGEVTWTDGTLGTKFPNFRWLNDSKAQVTLMGDKVQFVNGFGAKINMKYFCQVDMSGSTPIVLNVNAAEGRW
ncbi:zinc ribbon domain-containing protein [Comamonas piscis]|uniref:Zinc ribbon domain-containing protein n=1 Tax=Comamonas piscis TaxID=1562974 RepID=A0A7G5ELY4_9BURK|nr:zinc ribbon domain-containing protein [Comamonas piscis]QMV75009.1 zinc ribbon domain-containing protein [Comamonas piscis]WSO33489.1 zinc ribbon domain-containing protein [Comamonas piscis]